MREKPQLKTISYLTMKFSQAFLSGFLILAIGITLWLASSIELSLMGSLGRWSLPIGVLAGALLYLMILWLTNLFWARVASMQSLLAELHELFKDFSWLSIIVISIMAGIGEELLIRGVLQNTLVAYLGPWLGIVLASLVFGLMHYLSKTYVIVTFVLGLAFGLVYHLTDSLALVMFAHAVYDVFAFAVIVKYPHVLNIDTNSSRFDKLAIK